MNPLARVIVELPNHWARHRTETLWASRVDSDLYRVQSVPFFAYGLDYGDIVRATPVVQEVVGRSGHTTLRVVFRHVDEPRARQLGLLSELSPLGVSFESWGNGFFALDVVPGGDVSAVIERLECLEERDVLGFETCEARCHGSFDEWPSGASLRACAIQHGH